MGKSVTILSTLLFLNSTGQEPTLDNLIVQLVEDKLGHRILSQDSIAAYGDIKKEYVPVLLSLIKDGRLIRSGTHLYVRERTKSGT